MIRFILCIQIMASWTREGKTPTGGGDSGAEDVDEKSSPEDTTYGEVPERAVELEAPIPAAASS